MRTKSSVMPKTYWIEYYGNDLCDVIFATNVDKHTVDDSDIESSDTKQIEYVYDMYRISVPYSETLSDRIGENYQSWLTMAKNNELEEVQSQKLEYISTSCQNTIYDGIDVDTEYGKEHFSLTIHDQQNLSGIQLILAGGAKAYPYHADGKECVIYKATDLNNIISTATNYITYHTTYCNLLRQWIKRETDVEIIKGIYYGCQLPDDLKATLNKLL